MSYKLQSMSHQKIGERRHVMKPNPTSPNHLSKTFKGLTACDHSICCPSFSGCPLLPKLERFSINPSKSPSPQLLRTHKDLYHKAKKYQQCSNIRAACTVDVFVGSRDSANTAVRRPCLAHAAGSAGVLTVAVGRTGGPRREDGRS